MDPALNPIKSEKSESFINKKVEDNKSKLPVKKPEEAQKVEESVKDAKEQHKQTVKVVPKADRQISTEQPVARVNIPVDKMFPGVKTSEENTAVAKPPTPLTAQQSTEREAFYKPKNEVIANLRSSGQEYHYTYPVYDPNNLIGGLCDEIFYRAPQFGQNIGKSQMDLQNLAWILNMAMFSLPDKESLDNVTQEAIQFAILNSWRKAAPLQPEESKLIAQRSPFMQETLDYYRSHSKVNNYINTIYSGKLGMRVALVDSPLIREVFHREHPHPKLNLSVNSVAEFENLLEEILKNPDENSKDTLLIDLSAALDISQQAQDPDYLSNFFKKLNQSIQDKLIEARKKDPTNDARNKLLDSLLKNLQPFASFEYMGQSLIAGSRDLQTDIEKINQDYGFCPNPEQAIHSLLRLSNNSAQQVLKNYSKTITTGPLPAMEARLVTGKERVLATQTPNAIEAAYEPSPFAKPLKTIPATRESIGTVSESWADFTSSPTFTAFEKLSASENAPPYLRILPAATAALLKGFNSMKIDESFKDKGLRDVLQMSYFMMRQAMGEAVFRKDDFPAFNACIELIHQQIQNIFAFVHPYDTHTFKEALIAEYTSGGNPIIPKDLGAPQVYLKPSAMHCISSLLGAQEKLKGTSALNVVMLKDSYYESTGNLENAKTYNRSTLDGDVFNKDPDAALANIKNPPVDLFLCEFHHNISYQRQSYSPEKIKEQILSLFAESPKSRLAGHPLTVAIDTTINLQDSPELRLLLADPKIKELITKGELNLVIYRSAQKFDMLGMDNYYGGVMLTLNNGKGFEPFNTRMADPKDQLTGINLQGVTHVHAYAAPFLDEFRKAIMTATQSLYGKLPKEAIWNERSNNPMQISEIKDDNSVFFDIKFPLYPFTLNAVREQLENFAKENHLNLVQRASFGFATMNLTGMETQLRMNPGLEDEITLNKYAFFFNSIQQEINLHPGISDLDLARKIQNLIILSTPAAKLFHPLKDSSKSQKDNHIMQISQTQMKDKAYLQINFENEDLCTAFGSALERFQKDKGLPERRVFEFSGTKTELPVCEKLGKTLAFRFNPNMETPDSLAAYAEFFQSLEKIIWEMKSGTSNNSLGKEINEKIIENDKHLPAWRQIPLPGYEQMRKDLNNAYKIMASEIDKLYKRSA